MRFRRSNILLGLILCCGQFLSLAQNTDKIWKRINESGEDTSRLNSYFVLSNYFLSSNKDSAMWAAERALELAEKLDSKQGLCNANLQVGVIFQNTGDYNKANTYFFKALKYAESLNNPINKVRIFNSIANACAYQKMYDQALEYYQKALDFSDEAKINDKRATILMNMGNIAYSQGYSKHDFSKAYDYFGKAREMAEAKHDTDLLSSIYGNLALVYTDDQKYDRALEMIDKGMELSVATGADEDFIFLNYYAGRVYAYMKNYDRAMDYYTKSIDYSIKLKSRDYLSENYLSIAELLYDKRDYKSAYEYLEKHYALEDTLLSEETTQQLNELKTVYETDKKEKEIELSHQKLDSLEAQRKIIIWSSVSGGVLLMIMAMILLSRYRLKQKANKKLENAYSIIEEKQKDITDSINYAQKIQYAILPPDEEIHAAFDDAFVFFKPRDVVSGDFYWFHKTGSKNLIAAADCTGHGVPGALMSMIGSSLLNQIVLEGKTKNTGEILDRLRQGIKAAFKLKQGEAVRRDGMDVGLIAFDTESRILEFSGANNGLYFIRNGELKELQPDKQPIGQHEGQEKKFSSTTVETQQGDCFYLYTDGFADQFGGEKGKKFKYSKFKELLLSIQTKTMAEQREILNDSFNSWKGNLEQIDDVCIIGIRV